LTINNMKLHFIIDKNYDLQFTNSARDRKDLVRRYRDCEAALKYTAKEYQKSWDKIGDAFSRYVEKTTGFAWKHKLYRCVVSPTHRGISNWDGSDKIIRWWLENPLAMRRITAHELILHHFFCIIKNNHKQEKLSDLQIWALAEIAAFAMTSLTPESHRFWPWDDSGYYTNHNYQSLVPLQNKLKKAFVERHDFDDYVKAGIKAVKTYKRKLDFC
jgi:hypothetical protein